MESKTPRRLRHAAHRRQQRACFSAKATRKRRLKRRIGMKPASTAAGMKHSNRHALRHRQAHRLHGVAGGKQRTQARGIVVVTNDKWRQACRHIVKPYQTA